MAARQIGITADKMSQADVADAVKRAASLLKTLIVMQLIPEQAEKKCDDESNHSNDDDENGGYGKAKWLDHIIKSNEMHPEHKIDQGSCQPKATSRGQPRCQTSSSIPKALIGFTICKGSLGTQRTSCRARRATIQL